ncbi:MAG: S8 family serine peptidase [Phycisphaerales bacterium]|nr:S8 family serine peptidase [Phycisphaerales bacterium]
MNLPIIIATISFSAYHPNAYHFQSETVPFKDMNKGVVATELAQIRAVGGSTTHVLVRFGAPVIESTKDKLQNSGLWLQRSLGGATYITRIDPQAIEPLSVLGISDIREIRPLEPNWKLHRFLSDGGVPTWTMPKASSEENPIVALYVMLHEDANIQLCSEDLTHIYGGKIRSTIEVNNTIVVELPYSEIDNLIVDDRVLYVEPALPKFTELNNSNRVVTQADTAQSPPYDLDGDGVVVMVYDGGYGYSGHTDFGGRHHTRDSSGQSNHATHVAGTIGGDGSGSGGQYRGMAPAVTIESYGFEQEGGLHEGFLYSDPGDLADDYGQAINTYGAVLANNSIGTNTASNGFPCEWTGDYGITSNLIDSVVRGDLGGDIRIIWANGNERQTSNCGSNYNTTAPPACAKNHITVGAFNSEDESMTYFSSWGPTDDGRIKPDISAPGCQGNDDGGVTSCSSSGGYTNMCGTSMACPTVTGLSALIMEDWRNLYPDEADPMNSTLKALFAHTAEDKFNAGPDCQYGYGSVRVVNAIDHIRAGNHAELEITQGETVEMMIFAEQTGTIKATIAWDDVPATPLVIPSLVNDIDIAVIDPNGTTHYPWTIDPNNPGNPAVRTQPDHLNNIEQVQIDAGQPGVYRIVITGYNIAQGPQTFGLMASPMLIQCSSSGMTSFDRSSYACGATIGLQVVDCDLNTDDGVIDITTVTVSSTSGDTVDVVLTETGEATSSFAESIIIGTDIVAQEGDTLTVTYIDADDGQGGSNVVKTDTAGVDCSTPTIENITVSEVLTHEATVSITTNEDTSIRVYFGESCSNLDSEANSNQMGTSHEVQLTGLDDNTAYRFEVHASDSAGNTVVDDNNGICYTFVTADVPSFFTEQDSGFDLDGLSVTYTPYDNVDQYRACAEVITSLPSDPNGGSTVSLSDDDYESRSTPQPVLLYGSSYTTLYICSNGRVTFGSGSTDYTESIGEHFEITGISMLWDDLNPANGGTIRYAELSDRVVVTFNNVPEYSNTGSNTFQCELFFDGVVRQSWLGIDSNDNIVGLSAGGGTPQGFEENDLSASNDCGDPVVPGDVNGDGIVNVTDILAIMDAWGSCISCPEDLNGDGLVDVVDLLEVVGNWG